MRKRLRRRRRQFIGLFPRLFHSLAEMGLWLVKNPQPFLLTGVVGFLGWSFWDYMRQADVFLIAHVRVPPSLSLNLPDTLIGSNLLQLDIRELSADLHRQIPTAKVVRIVRELPNTLRVDAEPRFAVAQVWIDQWYPVDEEGFIMPESNKEPSEGLIRLVGMDEKEGKLLPFHENDAQRLQLALRVLKAVQQSPKDVAKQLVEINVLDPEQIRLQVQGGAEVRCGSEAQIASQLRRLLEALDVIAKESLEVRYIDLRFKEPVIGPKA